MSRYDAIFIGSGHNALVSAAYLARAGWRVLVLERNPWLGGWVRTAEVTKPGFRHDVYSSVIPLWLASRAHAELGPELEALGLRFANTPFPTGVALPDGQHALLATAMDQNLRELEALAPGDGQAWAHLLEVFGAAAPHLGTLFSGDLGRPEADAALREVFATPVGTGASHFATEFLTSARDVLERHFKSPVTRALLGSWPMHAGRGLDAAESGLWVPLVCGTLQMVGAPIVVGGIGNLVDALVRLIQGHGGELVAQAPVQHVVVEGGKAVGVRTARGEVFRAERVVVASTNPDQLYLELLDEVPAIPELARQQAARHRYGFGFVQLHVAMSEPPKWREPRLAQAGIVHLTSGLDAISRAVNEATRGLLPGEPTIGLDTPTSRDPTRAPTGKAILRIQAAEVPAVLRGDAAGTIATSDGWSNSVKQRFADRVLAIVSRHVTNVPSAIEAMTVIGPDDLAASNPNAGPGAITSATAGLLSSSLLRANHGTPLPNLFVVGAATWPGPAVSGGSGQILAHNLLTRGT
jgi:phytoene dehydrogenase-like protein